MEGVRYFENGRLVAKSVFEAAAGPAEESESWASKMFGPRLVTPQGVRQTEEALRSKRRVVALLRPGGADAGRADSLRAVLLDGKSGAVIGRRRLARSSTAPPEGIPRPAGAAALDGCLRAGGAAASLADLAEPPSRL
uniref:Uncharacterized protein n=1 Tax=Alexandrium catenella TaxID=2925 RepID=A0A7S1KVN5_ALECA